jgi:hypothetical protein
MTLDPRNPFFRQKQAMTPAGRFLSPINDSARTGAVMPDCRCIDCGADFPPNRGPGRPRRRCRRCAPPRQTSYFPRPRVLILCSECGEPLHGRQRVICGKPSCRERRFKRLHPESYAAREAAKVERRREARRAKREERQR